MYNTSQCDNTPAGTRFLSCVQQIRSRLGRTGAVTWICSSCWASVWWWIVVVLKLSVFHLLLKTGLHYLETAPAIDSGSASGSGLQLWELLLAAVEVQPYFSVRCFCSRIWVGRSAGRFLLRESCLVSWLAVLCDQPFLLLVSLFYNLLQTESPTRMLINWLIEWLVVEAWLIERSGFRMEGLMVNSEELKPEDFSGSDKVLTAASISAFCYHTHTHRHVKVDDVMQCDVGVYVMKFTFSQQHTCSEWHFTLNSHEPRVLQWASCQSEKWTWMLHVCRN